jgi:hypothetical protein
VFLEVGEAHLFSPLEGGSRDNFLVLFQFFDAADVGRDDELGSILCAPDLDGPRSVGRHDDRV